MRRGVAPLAAACVALSAGMLSGQGRGSSEWTTAGFDAQRSGWLRSDARLTKKAVLDREFAFLWKLRFENPQRQLNALTEPIILDRLIGFRGFKALGFLGGSGDRLFAVDTDLGLPYWTAHLNYSANTGGQPPSSAACPGGLIATPSRRTPLAPAPAGGPVAGGRGGRSGSAVGEPGRGAAVLSQAPQGRGAQQGRGAAMAPAGPVAPPAVPTSPAVAPIPFGGVDPIYAVGADGLLRTLRSSNGSESEPPAPFLPPSAKPSSLVFIDGIVYASTSGECGAAPNGVWAIDLTTKERKVATWKSGSAGVAGAAGPAFGTDGTLYAAVGSAPAPARPSQPAGMSDAVVALDRKSLERKDYFTAPGAGFNASPVVLQHGKRDLVAVTADNGRLYLLDGSSLGGGDHKTPLHVTDPFPGGGAGTALATWEDQGTRWILVSVSGRSGAAPGARRPAAPGTTGAPARAAAGSGSVTAFKLVDTGGAVRLERAWTSRPLVAPLAPIVVNGIVFAASSGEDRGAAGASAAARIRRSVPAVLYALDPATGKDIWNSGTTMTSFARGGLSAGAGQVYVVTHDNTLYAFGIPMEH